MFDDRRDESSESEEFAQLGGPYGTLLPATAFVPAEARTESTSAEQGGVPQEDVATVEAASPAANGDGALPPIDDEGPDWIDDGGPADPEDVRAAYPRRSRLIWAAVLSPIALTMLLAAVTQTVFTWWLVEFVPPPPRNDISALLNSHMVQIMLQQQEEEALEQPEVVEEEAEEEEEPTPEAPPQPVQEAEPEPEPEPEPLPEPEPEPEPEVAEVPEAPVGPEGDGGSGIAFATGPGNGTGPAIAQGTGTGRERAGTGTGRGRGDGEGDATPAPDRRDRREDRARDEENSRRVMRVEDTSEQPRVLRQDPELGYPAEFREAGITGNVVVECIITDRGRVEACRRRSGPEELAEYVISVVRQWRFRPAMDHEGNPVVSPYTFRIPFRLRD